MNLIILFLIIRLNGIFTYRHQKALKEKLWSERCKKKSVVLNDCNWCWCDQNQRYQCKARVCEEVDMFGHFKDAIKDINVGMEGKGSWRSRPTSCSPGVHYQRGGVLCVCDEDGHWPSPVCRDLFRVLHPVEITGETNLTNNVTCIPSKLHVVGCNVCLCPSNGYLDQELCTQKDCDEGDPILEGENGLKLTAESSKSENKLSDLEAYATCLPKNYYEVGCMNCYCIGNNRLLCDSCSSVDTKVSNKRSLSRKNYKSYCKGKKPGDIFKIDCNSCHCDENMSLFCTAKRCLRPKNVKLKGKFRISKSLKFKQVKPPPDDQGCVSGTQYKRDCNTCKCIQLKNGIKIVDCTLKKCQAKNPVEDQKGDCLVNSYYELDCKVCRCYEKNGVKYQVCQIHDCGQNLVVNDTPLNTGKYPSVHSHHGYCEPLHTYQNDCNICRCLSDGKTLMCESRVCVGRTTESLSVDMVPVHTKGEEDCPDGHSYKLDCNLCFCLSNGNAVCTTYDCSQEYDM